MQMCSVMFIATIESESFMTLVTLLKKWKHDEQ